MATRLAKDNAAAGFSRTLLIVGDPTSAVGREAAVLFKEYKLTNKFSNDYEQVPVSLTDAAAMATLAELYDTHIPDLNVPRLVVLSASGEFVATYPIEEGLQSGGPATRVLMERFLQENASPSPDAEQLLANTIDAARRKQTHVLVWETRRDNQDCAAFERFLQEHQQILDRYFTVVKINRGRCPHGKEAMQRLRGDKVGGLPWLAVLDQGAVVGSSDNAEAWSFHVPMTPKGIDQLLNLLATNKPGITSDELMTLRRSLETKR